MFNYKKMEGQNNKLIVKLSLGNVDAFTELYDVYSRQLYRNLYRLVKDEFVAEELLQDLFLKIWEHREKIDPEKSFKSFLYKVAENLVYTHYRKLAKDKRMVDKLTLVPNDFTPDPEEIMIRKEGHNLLRMAIENLSPQRKQIYTLCKLEGKSYDEVSTELGISPSTIQDHIVKGNKAVKKFLNLHRDIAVVLITAQLLEHLK